MKTLKNLSCGFSLLELLGVIVILVLLTSIVVTSVRGTLNAGNQEAARRQAQLITSAYQNYIAAGGEPYVPPLREGGVGATTTVGPFAFVPLEQVQNEYLLPLQQPLVSPNSSQTTGPFLVTPVSMTMWGSAAALTGWTLGVRSDGSVYAVSLRLGSSGWGSTVLR